MPSSNQVHKLKRGLETGKSSQKSFVKIQFCELIFLGETQKFVMIFVISWPSSPFYLFPAQEESWLDLEVVLSPLESFWPANFLWECSFHFGRGHFGGRPKKELDYIYSRKRAIEKQTWLNNLWWPTTKIELFIREFWRKCRNGKSELNCKMSLQFERFITLFGVGIQMRRVRVVKILNFQRDVWLSPPLWLWTWPYLIGAIWICDKEKWHLGKGLTSILID